MHRASLTQCSAHFTLAELTTTSTGIANEPDEWHVRNLIVLCETVLEPWRAAVGALRVTSGFRSTAVNAKIGGARGSQHLRGEAADVVPLAFVLPEAWAELLAQAGRGLPVGQCIVYERPSGRGWIHVSVDPGKTPRRQSLVQPYGRPGVYVPWADWTGPVVL